MKCPKCGYNSFETLDSCKKCNQDLTSFKESRGIRPIFLQGLSRPAAEPSQDFAPATAGITAGEELFNGDFSTAEEPVPAETDLGLNFGTIGEDDATSFSFAPETAPEATSEVEEPAFGDFSFEETASAQEPPPAPAQGFVDDSFADLLESSGAGDELATPAGEPETDEFVEFGNVGGEDATPEPPAAGGEFEMDFFFQEDETAAKDEPKKLPAEDAGLATDTFDSLFGELPEEGDKPGQ
ncbi:hypothetical protein [Geobacter sp. AOG1]|uniref:hypothetical protein n=1 Tax=Geobacter sp. AOG1 TaxID=1566346 RepID=UPI001CC81322|nr:hypothetical protein [Geobacter sp. AOG1]GFE56909.1 hypothetical protein AOG1_07880 [Geobacter sp. AOG1]